MSETPKRSRGILLALAGLVWSAGMLFSARMSITGNEDAELEVVSTAYAMPGAVSACVVGGATVALAVLAAVGSRRELSTTLRFFVAIGSGLVLGLLGALSIITINTEGWIYAVMGGTVAAAATIGGAIAGFRHAAAVAAACWASVAVFIVGVILAFLQDDLLPVFGFGDTSESRAAAAGYWGYMQGALGGIAAGLIAYFLLRRARRRTGGTDLRWPVYAAAGAAPGLMLIVAELLTRTAGARVLGLAGKVSTLDSTVQQLLSTTRLNNGLLVLFIGAFVAMVMVGRSIKGPADVEPDATAAPGRRKPTNSIPAAKPADQSS
jgi:iron complex transport system permease protein